MLLRTSQYFKEPYVVSLYINHVNPHFYIIRIHDVKYRAWFLVYLHFVEKANTVLIEFRHLINISFTHTTLFWKVAVLLTVEDVKL